VTTKVEYKELCRKINYLAEEIKELQGAVWQLKPSTVKGSEEAWENLMKLEEVAAYWQGPGVVEELRTQRGRGLKVWTWPLIAPCPSRR